MDDKAIVWIVNHFAVCKIVKFKQKPFTQFRLGRLWENRVLTSGSKSDIYMPSLTEIQYYLTIQIEWLSDEKINNLLCLNNQISFSPSTPPSKIVVLSRFCFNWFLSRDIRDSEIWSNATLLFLSFRGWEQTLVMCFFLLLFIAFTQSTTILTYLFYSGLYLDKRY